MTMLRSRRMTLAAIFAAAMLALVILVPTIAANNAALVIHSTDGSCGMLDGNGNVYTTTLSMVVITYSENENVSYRCEAKGLPNDSGIAVQFDYENSQRNCILEGVGSTQNWTNTVSASGNGTLSCHFRR